ncbi:Vitamin D-binding protein [Myotis davidii]|uniref:Vitamin D-binding protein n=1 Tax=Myotis davidii TaxID=225400 RepID=L5LGU8_MYODS|nr:Vitamin D-binding protein [Myotis davidii]
MKRILFLLLTVHALERGREYEKDKVCKELNNFGKDDFTSLSMVLYSRKFPSGTFEQISHLVKEVVSLTEACCAEGADPDCYDNRTSALSAKSCDSDSPFPVHPGTAECCTQEGLERKLCMAALKHQPQEFPTYVEPSNDEICEAFRKDPKEFANHHLIKLAQKAPTANLEDVLPLAEDVTTILSKCCGSTSEDCMAKELPEHTVKICDNLSTKNDKFRDCCQERTPMDIFMCVYFTPATQPPELPEVALPTSKDVCGKGNTKAMDRYTFELSRRTDVPEVFLSKILEPTFKTLGECCDSKDPAVCFDAKVPQLKEELSSFIDKGHELCADYSENTFTEYKKKLTERLRAKLPDAPDTELEELVEKRSDFASKCCSINSPPLYCDAKDTVNSSRTETV